MAVRRSALPKVPTADEDLHFQEGDAIEMRDVHGAWQPAVVTAVVAVGSASVPAGSLTVCLGDAGTCTIIPEMFGKLVRKPVQTVSRGSGASVKDEDVEQWNPDTYFQRRDDERSNDSVGKILSNASAKQDDAAPTCRFNSTSSDHISKTPSNQSQSSSKNDGVSICQSDPQNNTMVAKTLLNSSPKQLDDAVIKDPLDKMDCAKSDHASMQPDDESPQASHVASDRQDDQTTVPAAKTETDNTEKQDQIAIGWNHSQWSRDSAALRHSYTEWLVSMCQSCQPSTSPTTCFSHFSRHGGSSAPKPCRKRPSHGESPDS